MFLGGKELILWEGVVEDRKDPLLLGRVKVRIFGWHDEDKGRIPIETLPWAQVLLPPDDGKNVIGYKEKDFVCGYFRDGIAAQFPVILGKLPGIPEDPSNPAIGYNDPTPASDLVPGKVARPPEMITPPTGIAPPHVPISRYPLEDRLKESTASRLQRNEQIDRTIVEVKRDNLDEADSGSHRAIAVGTDTPAKGDPMKEPITPYDAKYPYNHIYESESGHIREYDDTPLKERIHEYHRAGTFYEIHPDGQKIDKAVNDRYEISLGNNYIISDKDLNATAKEEMRLLGTKLVNIESKADLNEDAQKNRNIFVGNDANTRVKNNVYTVIEGDVSILIKGTLNVIVEGDIKVKSASDVMVDGSNTKIEAKNENVQKAGKAVLTDGPLTYFNTLFTDGRLVRSNWSDESGVAESLGTVVPIPPIIPPPVFNKKNNPENPDKS